MSSEPMNRAPDAVVLVPEHSFTNRYERFGDVWFWVTDLERHIVRPETHWVLYALERATTPTTAGEPVAWAPLYRGNPCGNIMTEKLGADTWCGGGPEFTVRPLYDRPTPAADQRARDDSSAYAITLQRMIEAHCRGERVDESGSPHLGARLNAYHDQRARGTVTDAMLSRVAEAMHDESESRYTERLKIHWSECDPFYVERMKRMAARAIDAALHADAARTGSRAGREDLLQFIVTERDSERDEREGETRWHLLADEINKRLDAARTGEVGDV